MVVSTRVVCRLCLRAGLLGAVAGRGWALVAVSVHICLRTREKAVVLGTRAVRASRSCGSRLLCIIVRLRLAQPSSFDLLRKRHNDRLVVQHKRLVIRELHRAPCRIPRDRLHEVPVPKLCGV